MISRTARFFWWLDDHPRVVKTFDVVVAWTTPFLCTALLMAYWNGSHRNLESGGKDIGMLQAFHIYWPLYLTIRLVERHPRG